MASRVAVVATLAGVVLAVTPTAPAAACRYVGDWVAVKYRWSLSVEQAEHDVLSGYLVGPCAGAVVEERVNNDLVASGEYRGNV